MGTREAVFRAFDAGESVWFVEGFTSASFGAPGCHRIGCGWVAAADESSAKHAADGWAEHGRKLYGGFGFGAGHAKKARRESRDSFVRCLVPGG